MPDYDFALLEYKTQNLGDETQSIAARRFLPRVQTYIDRDRIDETYLNRPTKIIMNGWFTHAPERWPPKGRNLDPLFVSFHFSGEHGGNLEALTRDNSVKFLKQHEPIGCRDITTRDTLLNVGIDAYFSGCLTLSLERPDVPPSDEILAIDVPDAAFEKLTQLLPTSEPAATRLRQRHGVGDCRRKRIVPNFLRRRRRFGLAKQRLRRLAAARFVVTTRLHVALPCAAFGTPFLFVHGNLEDPRFQGLESILNGVQIDQFIGATELDLDALYKRRLTRSEFTKDLVSRVKEFVTT